MNDVKLKAVGTIRSPFTSLEGMPIQPAGAAGVKGTVALYPASFAACSTPAPSGRPHHGSRCTV